MEARPHCPPVPVPAPADADTQFPPNNQLCAFTQIDGASATSASGVCANSNIDTQVLELDQMAGARAVETPHYVLYILQI